MRIKGFVGIRYGRPIWYKNHTDDYREIAFCRTKTMAEQLWADVRPATLIIDDPKRKGKKK